jgi:hypothetical protein
MSVRFLPQVSLASQYCKKQQPQMANNNKIAFSGSINLMVEAVEKKDEPRKAALLAETQLTVHLGSLYDNMDNRSRNLRPLATFVADAMHGLASSFETNKENPEYIEIAKAFRTRAEEIKAETPRG